jgi:MFS family permease
MTVGLYFYHVTLLALGRSHKYWQVVDLHKEQGWRDLFTGRNAARSLVLASAVMLHGFFMFITATVLPSIVGEIGGVTFYAWVTAIFGIGSIAGAMLTPPILHALPARRAFEAALALFIVGSLLCALATNIAAIILGRAAQGLAGGVLTAVATSMIPVLFVERLRARAVALVSSVWGPIALVGPFVGGTIAHFASWRMAFWLALPLALLVGVLADRALPADKPQRRQGDSIFSVPQAVRLALFVGAVVILAVASIPGDVAISIAGFLGAALCLGAAIRLDSQAERRILLDGAFTLTSPVGASSTSMIMLVLGVGAGAFIPYVLVSAHAASPILAGYVAALSSLAWSIAALASAGARVTVNRGLLAVAPVAVLIALLGVAWALSVGSIAATALFWTLFGAGVGTAWPHLASRLIAYTPATDRAFAGGFVTTSQILAGTFGSALAGMAANLAGIARSSAPAGVTHGGVLLFLSFSLAALVAIVSCWRLLQLTTRERALAPTQ